MKRKREGHEEEEEEEENLMEAIGESIPGGSDALMAIADDLVLALSPLKFRPPVTSVYNPLVYARELYEQYVRFHGGRRIEVLLVGMNPGPFGMAQTGVPFGDSEMVLDFHGLKGKVSTPEEPHPKRPVWGLDCPRKEVSGQRLWGWAKKHFGSASVFFTKFWVYNYCPLVFMEASGKNRTPDKLHPSERSCVQSPCDRALAATTSILKPQLVVGVGKYAAERVRACGIPGIKIGDIMHPSPANPKANKGWDKTIESQLRALGVSI